jgi:hypothetical protein
LPKLSDKNVDCLSALIYTKQYPGDIMSKGTRPRPSVVSQEELAARYESIFGKKPPKERYVPPPLPPELAGPSSFEQQLGVAKLPLGRT